MPEDESDSLFERVVLEDDGGAAAAEIRPREALADPGSRGRFEPTPVKFRDDMEAFVISESVDVECDGDEHQCIGSQISEFSHQCSTSQISEFPMCAYDDHAADLDGTSDEAEGGENSHRRESTRCVWDRKRNRRCRRRIRHSLELNGFSEFSRFTSDDYPSRSVNIFGGGRSHTLCDPLFCPGVPHSRCTDAGDSADDFLGLSMPHSIFHEELASIRSPSPVHTIVMPLREAAKNDRLREACLRPHRLDGELIFCSQLCQTDRACRTATARPVGECLTQQWHFR